MDNEALQKMKELRQSLGIMAEMGLMFYRATLGAGATPEEARTLTQAYMAASMFGRGTQETKEGE